MRRVLTIVIVALTLCVGAAELRAETLPQLAAKLEARSEKTRIAAVVALGRTRDARALRPLVKALGDDSNVVRAVAATALGHLGDDRALPALGRSSRDKDRTVRKRALAAIARIQSERQAPPRTAAARRRATRTAHYSIAGHETPLLEVRPPNLFLVVKSAADESPGRTSKRTRKKRAEAMREFMIAELEDNRRVTLSSTRGAELELEPYTIDLSILALRRRVRGPYVEVECELRIAISNQRGKMLSFLTGGAKVQVPKHSFRRQYESQMQKEALENAVKSVHQDLLTHLRSSDPS